jgi:hypothetical protein
VLRARSTIVDQHAVVIGAGDLSRVVLSFSAPG